MLRLASASPRRIELLRTLGLPFEVIPSAVDESRVASPAAAKADAVMRPGRVTLAADTEVELGGARLGKPRDGGHAMTMLADLAGRTHEVRTEVVVVSASGARLAFAVRTRVALRALARRDIERYVAGGEPYDKAGAYAIQGEGRRLVERIEGCFANVTGLPLCHAYGALRRAGVVPAERPEVACQAHFDLACPVWRAARRQGRTLRSGAEYASWSDDVSGRRGV
ncbi:MAG TPA: Maf family protein [Candidatus Limnocylindria bacterium]|nr:Maf family protein [Candidatus Limnocylindria bacterium]